MSDQPERQEQLEAEFRVFMRKGVDLEAEIEEAGLTIREQSKLTYKVEWLDARLSLLSILRHLQEFKAGVPGATTASTSDRLMLVTVFAQGATWTERLISEGQYVKASAVLKQDFELLTRIHETKKGKAKPGKTPNVMHAPPGSKRFYGDLNDVAHPSNIHMLSALVSQLHRDNVHGLSPVPEFNQTVACSLYELHVWLIFEVVRETILLATEMYGKDEPGVLQAMRHFVGVMGLLEKAGFVSTESDKPV